MATTISSEVHTKMAENCTQGGRSKCQFEKMEVLQFFSQLNQAFSFGIVFWDSELIRHGNWGQLSFFHQAVLLVRLPILMLPLLEREVL